MTSKENLSIVLDGTRPRRLVFVLTGTLIAGLLEIIGIGTIPALVSVIVDPNWLFSALSGSQVLNSIREIERSRLLLFGAAMLCGVFLLKNLFLIALVYGETQFVQSIGVSVSNRLFRAYMQSPYHLHLQRNPAEVIRNLTGEAAYTMDFGRAGLRLIREGLVLILVFMLIVVVEPAVSLTVFSILAAISGILYFAVRRVLTVHGRLWAHHWSRRVQIINQSLGTIKEAKILGRESHLMALFRAATARLHRHETFHEVATILPRYFLETLAMAAVVLIAVIFILSKKPLGDLAPVLALFGMAMTRLLPAMTTINSSLVVIRYPRPGFEVVCAELKALESAMDIRMCGSAKNPMITMPGIVTLQNVHYCDPGAVDEALQGISATILPRTKVGFVGPSGAG